MTESSPAAPPVPPKGTERSRTSPDEFRYFCRVCCVNFSGDAARRHRAFNQHAYHESRKTNGSLQRVL